MDLFFIIKEKVVNVKNKSVIDIISKVIFSRRIQAINDTKIKYLSVADKIYEVVSIDWLHSYLEAWETDLAVDDVAESELWDISFFKDFRIRLINGGGDGGGMGDVGEIVDFEEWVERNKG